MVDALRRYIEDKLHERNETLSSAALAAGCGPTFLWELFNKPGVTLGPNAGKKLARWLGVSYAYLEMLEGREEPPDLSIEEAVAIVMSDERAVDLIKSWPELSEVEREHIYSSLEAVRIRRQRRDTFRSEAAQVLTR